jgi:hypothetical protein
MTRVPLWAAACLLLLAGPAARAAAVEPDLSVTPLARDGQVLVSFDLAEGLTSDVLDAIQSGLPTTFSYDVELRSGSTPGWFDRTVRAIKIAATVRFDNLTRRYSLSRTVDGRAEDALPTEDAGAMSRWMTHFDRVPLMPTSALEANGEYYVRVRARTRPRTAWFLWPWDRVWVLGLAKFTFLP